MSNTALEWLINVQVERVAFFYTGRDRTTVLLITVRSYHRATILNYCYILKQHTISLSFFFFFILVTLIITIVFLFIKIMYLLRVAGWSLTRFYYSNFCFPQFTSSFDKKTRHAFENFCRKTVCLILEKWRVYRYIVDFCKQCRNSGSHGGRSRQLGRMESVMKGYKCVRTVRLRRENWFWADHGHLLPKALFSMLNTAEMLRAPWTAWN